MDMEAASTSIISVLCVVHAPADRACLACICRIYILNGYACQSCLIFDKLCKPIERPGVQAVVVFTTFSCR